MLAEHIEKNQLWGDHGVSFISRMVLGLRATDVYNAALKDQFIMAFPQGGRTQSSAARETAAAELSANDNALLRLLTETLRKVPFLVSPPSFHWQLDRCLRPCYIAFGGTRRRIA